MRVILTGVAIEGGGAEQVIQDLASGLVAAGHQVTLAFLEGTEQSVPSLEAQGICCLRLLQRQRFAESALADFTPGCVFRFAGLFRRLRPDVIHSHIPRPTLWVSLAKRLTGRSIPLVYTEHSIQEIYPSWARWLYRLILPRVDHVVAVSEAAERSFLARWGWSSDRVGTIWNGIDVERMAPTSEPSATRRRLAVEPSAPFVLNVARTIPAKAQEILVQAMARVHETCPDARCLIAGTAEHGSETAKLVADTIHGLSAGSYVQMLGDRSDIPDLLAASDVFVLSSRQEGFPITILEAMAAGKPVVATDVGGCAEAVVHGETGLIVPPEDPDALANAILQLLQNPEQARRMGEAGRKRVEGHFTVGAMVRKHIELYERLIADKRR